MKKTLRRFAVLFLVPVLLCACSASVPIELDDGEGTLYQYELPQSGDTIAIFHTSKGDITVRFFPEEAPKAVKNFITLAEQGFYDGKLFFRTINNFMIQAGSPDNTTAGGESIWGGYFEDEFSPRLHNLRGALCMANSGANTNGSQFFIVQSKKLGSSYVDAMTETQKSTPEYGYTQKVIDAYQSDGGCSWLDRKHTVFGQVIDGMDVVDLIARSRADTNDRPVSDIVIEKVEIAVYG